MQKKPDAKPMAGHSNRSILLLIMIVLAALLPYISSLRGGFTLDDGALIVSDPLIRSLSNIPEIFHTDFLHGNLGDEIGCYYRPLITTSFALDYSLWGLNSFAFRITNLLMNLIVVLLVFGIGKRLSKSNFIAGLAAISFAVLPSHAESVSWICGRTDIIATIFILASLLLFMTLYETKPKFSWLMAVICSILFGCALFSKESGLVVILLMAAYAWIFGKGMRKGDLLKWVTALAPMFVIYFIFRRSAVGSSLESILSIKLAERLGCVGIAYAAYLRMLFLPQEMRAVYDVFPMGVKHPAIAAAAWMLPIGLVGLTIWAKKRAPIVAFGSLWIFLTLLPVSNILPTIGPLPAERFVYLASVGSSLIIGWLALQLYNLRPKALSNWPTIAMIVICGFILYSAALTVQSCKIYQSDLSWARTIAASNTRFGTMHSAAGRIFYLEGYPKEACKEIEAVIAVNGELKVSDYVRLAVAKRTLGLPQESLVLLKKAKHMFGDKPEIEYHMGIALAVMGQLSTAADAFLRATQLDPKLEPAWRNLGKANFKLHRYREAITSYERAASLTQLSPGDRLNLGLAYKNAAMPGQALRMFQQVVIEDTQGEPSKIAAKEILSIKR